MQVELLLTLYLKKSNKKKNQQLEDKIENENITIYPL